jgi:hypothetical protein
MHDRHPIGSQMHVEFQAVGACRHAKIECSQRVLGSEHAAAAMREDQRLRVSEESHQPKV